VSASSPASRGFPLVVLAALCWGTSGVSGRIVADRTDLGPLDIARYRMAIGAVVLLAGFLLTRRRRPASPVRLTRPVAVRLGLVAAGLAGYQLAYFAAVATAGVSVATLVALGLAPLFIALGGTALGSGRPDGATIGALAVAVVGLGLLVGLTAGASAGTAVLLGAC
jgi:DME family drug/metabolite transporter